VAPPPLIPLDDGGAGAGAESTGAHAAGISADFSADVDGQGQPGCDGEISGELNREEATQEKILNYATGLN